MAMESLALFLTILLATNCRSIELAALTPEIIARIAAQHSLVFRNRASLHEARYIDHVVFDKTSILTEDMMTVAEEKLLCPVDVVRPPKTVIQGLLLTLLQGSRHPTATSICRWIRTQGIEAVEATHVQTIKNSGVQGFYKDAKLKVGSSDWLGVTNDESMVTKGLTIVNVSMNGALIAAYGLRATVRSEAAAVIKALKRRQVKVSIISGDNMQATQQTAKALSMHPAHAFGGLFRIDKKIFIAKLTSVSEACTDKSARGCRASRNKGKVLYYGSDPDLMTQSNADLTLDATSFLETDTLNEAQQSQADMIVLRSDLRKAITAGDLSKAYHLLNIFSIIWIVLYQGVVFFVPFSCFIWLGPSSGEIIRWLPIFAGAAQILMLVPMVLGLWIVCRKEYGKV